MIDCTLTYFYVDRMEILRVLLPLTLSVDFKGEETEEYAPRLVAYEQRHSMHIPPPTPHHYLKPSKSVVKKCKMRSRGHHIILYLFLDLLLTFYRGIFLPITLLHLPSFITHPCASHNPFQQKTVKKTEGKHHKHPDPRIS